MRQAALLVAVCLVVAPLAGAVGATDSTAQSTQDALEKEGVHITVELQPDGDAHWNVSARYALEDENDTAAFDDLAREFKSGDRDRGGADERAGGGDAARRGGHRPQGDADGPIQDRRS